MFLLFKERRPFKLKKEYPSEQWQIISFRLIPLKTPVSFRWTVPLIYSKINVNSTIMTMIFYSSGMKRPKKFANFSKWGCMVRPEKWERIVTKPPGTKRPI
jgi:hypothetical protein